MKISAIVVTYNRLSLLKECLKALLSQTYKLNNIFIVNNNSNDGTKQYLNSIKSKIIKPINMSKNLNGAGGFSIGTKIAFEHSNSDCFWLMDDDTIPSRNSLKALVLSASKLKYHFGFLSSNVRWWKNNEPCNMPIIDNKDWTKLAASSLIKIKEATFVSFFVPRYVVRKFGLPISKMVIWGDDTEYTSRISNKLSSYLVTNSIVYHKAKSVDLSCFNLFYETSKSRINRYKYMYRNRLYVERKYRSTYSLIKWLMILFLIFVKIPFKSKNRRLMRMCCVVIGTTYGLFFNPKISYPNLNKKE